MMKLYQYFFEKILKKYTLYIITYRVINKNTTNVIASHRIQYRWYSLEKISLYYHKRLLNTKFNDLKIYSMPYGIDTYLLKNSKK